MKEVFFSGVVALAMYGLLIIGAARELDQPRVFISWSTGQFRYMIYPDARGNEVRVNDWRDPRYRAVLKSGRYRPMLVQ